MWPAINRCEVCQRSEKAHTVFASRRAQAGFQMAGIVLQAFGALVDFQRSQLVFKCNQNITSLHHAPLSQATILKSAPSPVSSVYIGKCCRTEIFGTEAVIVGISKDALSKFSLATTTVTTHQQRVSSIITADSSDTMAQ